ncbi:MAG: TonB C-terminal domain-containing protein, partial [Alteraurantiacibacter sp.]|nr:TonB C-terminal domain-containing protein [Alteraurantiacibacter sp.]
VAATQPSPPRAGGGSRLDQNFISGLSDGTGETGQAADRPNAQQQASIDAAIIRQLKPHWNPPSGLDVDKLVTVVRFRLNRDGTLNGNPEVLRTTGVNETNRAQVARHQEQAVRAVRLAAAQGFDLPERFYSGWSVVTTNFDNRLAQ